MAYTTIDDPSEYFHTQLYTGSSSGQSITNDANAGDFKPDWVWIKRRDGDPNSVGNGHNSLYDSTRGVTKEIYSDLNSAEATNSNALTAFGTDGFTVGTEARVNSNGLAFVAWQWKANGGTTTSFSASGAQLAGNRQSNTTAGFSIIQYTGDGNNNATIPHGLNSAPKFVIIKDRGTTGGESAANWYVGHASTFTTGEIFLNQNNALAAAFGPFNKTAPTASNIVLGTDGNVNGSSDTMICYAFAEVQGYSKFGSYYGNGNADGPFVYTGFKPQWILHKDTGSTEQWQIKDTTRFPFNPNYYPTFANLSNVEGNNTNSSIDFLSNGFKIRNSDGSHNTNGNVYIYMAFAEHPFVSSKGVPVTAR